MMCGICGIHGPHDEALLARMTDVIAHRGPDDAGIYRDGVVGLGIRRLSIIDLSGGHQPIANEDGTLWIVYNGEIYNFREIRESLEAKGHRFTTKSDTEVILHAFEEYGEACVHLFRGMFAFALWDAREGILRLCRDRLGIKPLYYAQAGGAFLFGSEIKSILEHPAVVREVDPEALDLYLTFQYVPGPRTLFRGIRKLPPGHWLRWRAGSLSLSRYWDLVIEDAEPGVIEAEAVAEFRDLLEQAVRLRLLSDVPLGALLSGGIDSSTVVALMSRASGVVKTFTVGFDVPGEPGEIAEARAVAAALRTDHHEVIVGPSHVQDLPRLIWHMDEPIADPAALPTYFVCRLARELVTVVLTGEGGDELLGGYPRYAWFRMAQRLGRWLPPLSLDGPVLGFLGAMAGSRGGRLRQILADLPPPERHIAWIANFTDADKTRLYAADFRAQVVPGAAARLVEPFLADGAPGDMIQRLMAVDVHTWLVDDILTKVDKMSMATSVEARVPLLDHRLVEFVATLPIALKVRNLGTKRLLRQAVTDLIPQRTVARRKRAFQVPVAAWLRQGLREFAADILLSRACRERGYFQPGVVGTLLEDHLDGRADHSQKLWNLLCLELWHRVFMDGEAPGPAEKERSSVRAFGRSGVPERHRSRQRSTVSPDPDSSN
jgi:asparagine synthase (glutamine-hydrolysing)